MVDERLDLPKIVISVFRFNDGNFSALSDFPNRHGDEVTELQALTPSPSRAPPKLQVSRVLCRFLPASHCAHSQSALEDLEDPEVVSLAVSCYNQP
jgi:hypothetical protein